MSAPKKHHPAAPAASKPDSSIMSTIKGFRDMVLGSSSSVNPNDAGNEDNVTAVGKDGNPELDDDELDHEWAVVESEDTANEDTVWTLDADRQLVTLWFFSTCSFIEISSLLNYSLDPPLFFRVTPEEAKTRFLLLAKQPGYSRAYIYHETFRLSQNKGVDWSAAIRAMDNTFAVAWTRMESDLKKECEAGEQHRFKVPGTEGVWQTGYDGLSNRKYKKVVGKPRLWNVGDRKFMQECKWEGLGAKVPRPVEEKLGSQLGIDVQHKRKHPIEKKGWISGVF